MSFETLHLGELLPSPQVCLSYESNSKKLMENDGVSRHDWWAPETPSKRRLITRQQQHTVHVGSDSPVKLISDELDGKNQALENGSFDDISMADGANNPSSHSLQSDDVQFYPPLYSQERKNSQREVNGEPQKRTKKKVYRPKVISQLSKRAKESQPKSSNSTPKPSTPKERKSSTPKPSTPKQRKSYVRKDPKCRRSLFFDENSISLPFLKNFNDSKVEQGGFENSTIKNESGIEYNSLQSYLKLTSLLGLCLVESRRVGVNFMCKKKRMRRHRIRLEKLLIPSAKGKRSKSFVRKRKCWTEFLEANSISSRKMSFMIKKIKSLKKKRNRKTKQLDVHKKSGELVLYKRSSLGVDVILDDETLRVWNLLTDERGHEENDEKKRMYWEEIRRTYRDLVASFISRMHFIQGDRRFSPWKGSVIDSVVGVLLTQNVADHLSSSAYMSLAAKFPVKSISCEQSNMDPTTPDGQELIRNNVVFSDPKFDKQMEDAKVEEMEAQKANESSKVDNRGTENNSSFMERYPDSPGIIFGNKQSPVRKKNKNQEEKEKILERKQQYWDILRKIHTKSHRHSDHVDSVDWEAVRSAKASEVANAIASRGQHYIITERIQGLLNKLMDSYGSVDLEWLRYAPPREAKEYLLNIHGLGLKSVECIRLLTLQHIAFPVDVNVGRIVVRLGWVPLQPLPEPIQIHNLEEFPDSNKIQQFLWPRLCTLDQRTLYELHYQLITFGKVFCTKKNPNCNACPMRKECKHFASALARTKLALPEPTTDQRIVVTPVDPTNANFFQHSSSPSNAGSTFIREVYKSLISEESKECEPIIEMPASPEPESTKTVAFGVNDEEIYNDGVYEDNGDIEDIEDILTINLSSQESLPKTRDFSSEESKHDMNPSTALVALHEDAANIPMRKMKVASRLKTERVVYVLTDNHPLLAECPPREPDDPSPYLLVEWIRDELESSFESSNNSLQEEDNSETVLGTLLIPCRTAMRGYFPLNGTYFQVNEVFADHASMVNPISVPRKWIWYLEKRTVYFGTGTSAIMKGLSLKQIHDCFWKGFVCVRAIDTKTRAPRPLSSVLHRSTTANVGKKNKNVPVNE